MDERPKVLIIDDVQTAGYVAAMDKIFAEATKENFEFIQMCNTGEEVIEQVTQMPKKSKSLLDILKAAELAKNTQAHRIVPGTKKARQHLANSRKDIVPNSKLTIKNTGRGS